MTTSIQTNQPRRTPAATERVNARATVTPAVDVYENDAELLLIADVPGATAETVSIHFDRGQLTLEAKRAGDAKGATAEFAPYDYLRIFSVPQGIDSAAIKAELKAGVLRVRLPKAEAAKPRRIAVTAG